MIIGAARDIAKAWVQSHGMWMPGFLGACVVGSTNGFADNAEMERTSDLDILVVLDTADVSVKPGKFRYRGVLLEISTIGLDAMSSPEQVLGDYHLAGGITGARILADPSGHLGRLQRETQRHFADRYWVERRVRQAIETVLVRIASIEPMQAFAEQVMAWLFAAGGLPHVLLIAGLRNPTVRKRYVAVRDLLADAGGPSGLSTAMLDLIDPKRIAAGRVLFHLDTLAETFDMAGQFVRSPFFFASDLSSEARPLSIDGSRDLVEAGLHREALFWIVATFCRCQIVLQADAPASLADSRDNGFHQLLADLDIRSLADLEHRCEKIRELLPEVELAAERLMDLKTTPGMT